jgi:hypothetical protein
MRDFHDSPFTHYGWMLFAPVYVGHLDHPYPILSVRDHVPEFVLDAAEFLVHTYANFRSLFNPEYELKYPIRVTSKLPTVRAM